MVWSVVCRSQRICNFSVYILRSTAVPALNPGNRLNHSFLHGSPGVSAVRRAAGAGAAGDGGQQPLGDGALVLGRSQRAGHPPIPTPVLAGRRRQLQLGPRPADPGAARTVRPGAPAERPALRHSLPPAAEGRQQVRQPIGFTA